MASPAQDRVFSSPELLEMILLALPSQDILLAQQLSRTFQRLIHFSPAIRQRLFLQKQHLPTRHKGSTTQLHTAPTQYVRINQPVAKLFPFLFRSLEALDPNRSGSPFPLCNVPWNETPVETEDFKQGLEQFAKRDAGTKGLSLKGPPARSLSAPQTITGDQENRTSMQYGMSLDRPFDIITRKGASWRRMFPIQPPLKSLRLVEVRTDRVSRQVRMATVRGNAKNGLVTMGQIYDICADHVVRSQHASGVVLDILGSVRKQALTTWRFDGIGDAATKVTESLTPDTGVLWMYWTRQCSRRSNTGAHQYVCDEIEGWLPPHPGSTRWKNLFTRGEV